MNTTEEFIKSYIKERKPILIIKTKERGFSEYAVACYELPIDIYKQCKDDFWLDAFKTKKEALEFCRKNKLPIE